MNLVNLTNRPIVIVDDQGCERLTLKPSGIVVGVSVIPKVVNNIQTESSSDRMIDVVTYKYEGVSNLPPKIEDTMYVVSFAVLQALNDSRADVVSPDTSPGSVVRAPNTSRVIGVQRFRKL